MTFVPIFYFTVVTAACGFVNGHVDVGDKCAGMRGVSGRTCNPTACVHRNTSCPLIPDVLCASDECGCHVAFYALANLFGRETRTDVTDLCRATVEIKEASELMEGLLAGEVDECELVASDPDVLLRVFPTLNFFSLGKLRDWIWCLDAAVNQDRSPAMENRRQFLASEFAALEERMRRRESDGLKNSATQTGNVSHASSKEAQRRLQRRKDIIRQWTKRQERVKVLDESVSMFTLLTSARMASKKYAVDNQGAITGSQLPLYGSILYSLALTGGGLASDETANGEKTVTFDPSTVYKIKTELHRQLNNIVLDEIIARRQLRRSNFHFTLPAVSAMNSRVRFSFPSFAPQMQKTGLDGNNALRLMSLAAQTAALGMDLYSSIAGRSPTALADFVLDWNIADDLTEFLF